MISAVISSGLRNFVFFSFLLEYRHMRRFVFSLILGPVLADIRHFEASSR